MKPNEMDRFIQHCNTHFQQGDPMILHNDQPLPLHVDILLYEPTKRHPYWKLVTMGASDYKMPKPKKHSLSDRNEYIMLVDESEDLKNNQGLLHWYVGTLYEVAFYPQQTQSFISYGHSIEWGKDENSDMVGATIQFPQFIGTLSFLDFKPGLFKTITCLQVVTITQKEMEYMLEIGPEKFSNYIYPENDDRPHFLCERYRTERF